MTECTVSKYKIEGGIDFYKELFKSEAENPNNVQTPSEDANDKCLLTNGPLTYGHIELPCGHKYNFFPLYTETLYQKTNPAFVKNVYNVPVGKDKIKCPYCRTIHSNCLLPYIVNGKRIVGVNGPVSVCSSSNIVTCQWMLSRGGSCKVCKNIHYVPDSETPNGCAMFLCKRHLTQMKNTNTPITKSSKM
jgi:hypothetical protein